MDLYNLIGRRRRHDVIDAVPLLAAKTACKCFPASVLALIWRFFINILIEMNVNISNELNFSDVYRSVNYIGSVAKFT